MSWRTVEIKEVAPATPATKDQLTSDSVWNITLDQIESNTGKISNKKYISVSKASQSTNYINGNNVLYSKLRPNLNKVIISDEFAIATSELIPLFPDKDRLVGKYLLYYLRSEPFVKWASVAVTGAKMPRTDMKQFWKYPLPLPPLEDQKRIVDLLDRAQALIDKRKEQIGLMDKLIQSLFYDMFGDPDIDDSVPTAKLKSICNKITDGTHQSPQWASEGYPFLFVSNIKNRTISFNTTKFISHEEFLKLTKTTPIELGDILYTVVGSYGNPALIKTDDKFAFQRHIGHLKPNHKIVNATFLECALETVFVNRQADSRVTGVAQKTLILRELKEMRVVFPSLTLQNIFAEHVNKIETQKQAMLTSLVELEDNFSSISQRAFKGEI